MDFETETDAILRDLVERDYATTVAAVDDLQERAISSSGAELADAIKISCAELRFDAALATSQPFQECERRYEEFLALGVDERTELMKSIIFAKETKSQRAVVIRKYVVTALSRVAGKTVPKQLVAEATQLVESSK